MHVVDHPVARVGCRTGDANRGIQAKLWRVRAELIGERSRWLEPTLGLLAIAVVSALHSWEQPTFRLIDVVICLGAALSGVAPRIAAVISGAAVLSYLFMPADSVSAAGLAVFINVFAAFRLGLPERLPITMILSAIAYVTLVRHAYGNSGEEATATVMLVIVFSIAVGTGQGWHQSKRRLAVERVGAEERVSALRLDLARDLHDTVAQTLSHAAMRAHMASMRPDVTPELATELERIASDCSSSSQDLRQLLQTLREQDLGQGAVGGPLADADSLADVVRDQAARLSAKGLHPVASVDIGALSAARATTLSKITVEAASNMLKHAPLGSTCHLQIREDADNLVATFSNPSPSRPVNRKGLGLIGIEERVSLLGGTCAVDRTGATWRLTVTLPHGYEGRAQGVRRGLGRGAKETPELQPPSAPGASR